MNVLSPQLSVTTKLIKPSSSFNKQLKYYNLQEKFINYRIQKLITTINHECKIVAPNQQKKCIDHYVELQEEYDNIRNIKYRKHELYLKHNLFWDEEFF